MSKTLREAGAELKGAVLLVPCQGEHACCGMIRVPFLPGQDATEEEMKVWKGYWWNPRGTNLEDICLKPSIDAGKCGHFCVVEGKILPS